MARLKVKQISDFTTAVQTLIDNDVDQNAGDISSALSAGVSAGVNADGVQTNLNTVSTGLSTQLSTEVAATNADVTRIDAVIASAGDAADVTAISTEVSTATAGLAAEIQATNGDVTRIDGLLASVATDGELASEVTSIDLRVSNSEDDVTSVSNAVSAILAGSDVNLDQFAEVVAYVDSLETVDGGLLTAALASIDTAISVSLSAEVVLTDGLAAEVSTTNSDILSIESVLGTMGTSETITNISNGLSAEISTTNSEIVAIDNSIDALEAQMLSVSTDAELGVISDALVAEILATGNEITAIDNSIDALQAQMLSVATDAELGTISTALSSEISATNSDVLSIEALIGTNDDYKHEMGTFVGGREFSIANGVKFGANDDLLVFVNGHNIHPKVGEIADGYVTTDGVNFTLTNLGYLLEADDHVYVTGMKA